MKLKQLIKRLVEIDKSDQDARLFVDEKELGDIEYVPPNDDIGSKGIVLFWSEERCE